MDQFLAQLISAAVVGAFSPVATMATIAVLAARSHRLRNALALLLGWTALLVVLAGLLLALFTGADAALSDKTKALLNVIIGILLLSFSLRNLLGSRHPLAGVADGGGGPPPRAPGWMSALDSLSFLRAIGIGAVLLAVSPADLAVYLSALQGLAGRSSEPRLLLTVLLIVAIDLCILIPLGIYVLLPGRATAILGRTREYLLAHQRTLLSWVCAVFGVLLLVSGVVRLG